MSLILQLDLKMLDKETNSIRENEEHLQRARLAAIVESSEDAIISKDLEGIITSWNRGAEKLFGYTADETIGKPITILIPRRLIDEEPMILERIRRGEQIANHETIRRRKDGREINISLTVSPIRSEAGYIIGASKIARDITERVTTEEVLRENQMMLALAMQSSHMGAWQHDITTGIVIWSDELEEIFGLEKGGFGETRAAFYELIHEDDREKVWGEVEQAVAEHRDYAVEFRFYHTDGSIRWMEGRGQAVYSDKGEPVRLYGIGIDITERKNTEASVRQSEKLYRTLFDLVPIAVYTCDANGLITEYNQRAVELWGREPRKHDPEDKFCGSFKIFYPDGRTMPHEKCPMARVLRGETLTQGELEILVERPDGVRRNIVPSPQLLKNERGESIGAINCLYDFTETKQTQKKLIDVERRAAEDYQALLSRMVPLAQALGTARKLLTVYRTVGEFVRASMPCSAFFISFHDAAENLRTAAYAWGNEGEVDVSKLPPMNLTADGGPNSQAIFQNKSVIVNDYWDFMQKRPHVVLQENGKDPHSAAVVPMKVMNRILGTFEVQAYEKNAFSDEHIVALEMVANLAAVAIENVRLLETEQFAREEAEQRWREGEILQSVSRTLVGAFELDAVTEIICKAIRELLQSDGATFVLHEKDSVHYKDENAISPLWKGRKFPIDCCISGWSIRERKPVAIADIYADDRIPHDAYSSTFVKSLAMMPVGPDEPVAAIGAYWATHHEATRYEVGLLQSLANLADLALSNARSYEKMRRARSEAEAANRAKDEFLSVLSHELRTPLNAMLGWIRMLGSGELDTGQTAQAVETIERNARLQNHLIEDLLDVSRIISGNMRIDKEEVNIVSIVKTCVETALPSARQKNLSLAFQSSLAQQELMGDTVRLQQIVNNLINNAVKFTPDGGSISVTLEPAVKKVQIKVEDTGIGISPEFLPMIFDRFKQADSTTKRAHTGLGLGLTIVRHLTELHGGKVKVFSGGEAHGSTFIIELPVTPGLSGSAFSENGATKPENNSKLKGARIMLVDDDCEGIQPLQILLETQQANVFCAESAKEALEKLSEERFDILISDIGMPGMDGFELIDKVRKLTDRQNYRLPAIALTAYAASEDRERVLSAGYKTHLTKPVDFDDFLSTVDRLLNGDAGKV